MNKKFRYYQCSNNRIFENSGRKCHGLLIRANELEEKVWNKTREVLENPEVVLKHLAEATDQKNIDSLEKDIKELENNLLNYEKRRSNLLEAKELGEFGKNEILDRLSNIKHFRIEDEIKLGDLKKTRDNISSLANAKIKLNHLYNNVMDNLQDSTIEIKVYAKGNDTVEIQGIIPLELASSTTAQTSASMLSPA
jgi:hypothetical protein